MKELNNLVTNTLYIGQVLQVPRINQDLDEPMPPQIDDYNLYEVQKGDSLWLIAQKNNITVEDLINLNNLSSTVLQIGDKLKIPKIPSTDSNIYVVKKGDTLWSIARENNISVSELKTINNLTSNLLTIGQELLLR